MIMDNDEMQQEMMQVMRNKNSEGKLGDGGMMANDGKMGSMSQEQLQQMMQRMLDDCAQDSANCTIMSKMMMSNSSIIYSMMMQMHEKGTMDEACYQQMKVNMHKMDK
ncbi:hypothetical protein [Pontibacter oryzae]|uniref:Uncharacterized protein n=1 Tax=Pontibacter oryzae TaxID=2304593 RepID=A0A399SEF8_9BACT|nr:hypothetical protein [Pontibacter oryzae]RIJ42040.1 hypothetical protein D1627_08575 [Pontibacter oryzae]